MSKFKKTNKPTTSKFTVLAAAAATLLLATAAHGADSLVTTVNVGADYQVKIPQEPTNTESLMLWAEQTYPQFFAGHPKTVTVPASGTTPSVAYRYYPQTGNYLAVSPADVTTTVRPTWKNTNPNAPFPIGIGALMTTPTAITISTPAAGAKVYVLGAATQNQAVAVGIPADFKCAVHPGRCLPNAYTPGSLQQWYFEEVNDVRVRMGMGALQQDTRLDTAATSHAMYGEYGLYAGSPHTETPGTKYFTGVTAEDRAKAAGYPVTTATSTNWVGEAIGFGSISDAGAAQLLLNTVYHRLGLLSSHWTHIGIGISDSFSGAATVMNPACLNACATVPEGWMATYPLDGQQNVPTWMTARETPDPAPEFAVLGAPVSIHIKPSATNNYFDAPRAYGVGAENAWLILHDSGKEPFIVTTFTLTAPDGSVVPGKVMYGSQKPDNVFFVPSVALTKNTTYTVHFLGDEMSFVNPVQNGKTANGQIKFSVTDVYLRTIDKTWSFTTGGL